MPGRVVNKIADMPPLDAEIVAGNRMITAGRGTENPAVFYMQVQTAAAAAISAGGKNVLHGFLLQKEKSVSILLDMRHINSIK